MNFGPIYTESSKLIHTQTSTFQHSYAFWFSVNKFSPNLQRVWCVHHRNSHKKANLLHKSSLELCMVPANRIKNICLWLSISFTIPYKCKVLAHLFIVVFMKNKRENSERKKNHRYVCGVFGLSKYELKRRNDVSAKVYAANCRVKKTAFDFKRYLALYLSRRIRGTPEAM